MSLERNKKDLLYFLSSHPQLSYEEIGKRLSLSKRSIKLLIESLLYRYGHIFSIQEKEQMLQLHVYDQKNFLQLVTENLLLSSDLNSFHKRQAVFFQMLIKADGYLSAEDMAEQLNISRRSLSRDMIRMKSLVASYGLELASKTGIGLRLKGSELAKRLLYLYEVMDYVEDEIHLPDEIYRTYEDVIASRSLPLDVQRTFLATLKLAWERRNYPLDSQDFKWFTQQEQLDLPRIFYDIISHDWGRPLNNLEKQFLTFPMQLGLMASEVERPDILSIVETILEQTAEEYGIQLAIREDARLLQCHVIYMLNRSTMKWDLTEIGLRDQLARSSFSQVVSQFFVNRLSEVVEVSISEKEVFLLAAWMDLLLARKSKPLIAKIAVISQAGPSFNILIREQIEEVFGKDVQVDFLEFTNHQPYEELNQKYDLIFIDNLMYSQELFQSFLSLTLVTKENQAEREKVEGMVLARKIQLSCQVFTTSFEEKDSYETNLSFLLHRLEERGLLTARSVDRLLEKESHHPALSETGFAFPHLTVQGLEQLTLVVHQEAEINLSSQTGLAIRDFVLLLIPADLEEGDQNLLYQIFDNTFRRQGTSTIHDRLGISFMKSLPHIHK